MSFQNRRLRAKLTAGFCTSQRAHRPEGFPGLACPSQVLLYTEQKCLSSTKLHGESKHKLIWSRRPKTWTLFYQGSDEFSSLRLLWFRVEFDVHPCTHHFSFPLIFPMCACLLSTLSFWNWCLKAAAGFIYDKVPFLKKKNLLAKYQLPVFTSYQCDNFRCSEVLNWMGRWSWSAPYTRSHCMPSALPAQWLLLGRSSSTSSHQSP